MKKCTGIAAAAALVFLSGCASNGVWFTGPRGTVDKSYPQDGSVIETGTLTYIENKTGLFTKKTVEEQRREPESVSDIYVQGNIQKEKFSFSSFFKGFLDSENTAAYDWTGFIRTQQFELPLEIQMLATRLKTAPDEPSDEANKMYTLEQCAAGDAVIQFFDIYNDEKNCRAPHPLGNYTNAANQIMTIHAGREPKWTAHGKNAGDDTAVDAVYPKSSIRQLYTAQDQLFQITDETGIVYASISGNVYTIYNTVPEDMIADIKCFMGMFHAWKSILEDMEKEESL